MFAATTRTKQQFCTDHSAMVGDFLALEQGKHVFSGPQLLEVFGD